MATEPVASAARLPAGPSALTEDVADVPSVGEDLPPSQRPLGMREAAFFDLDKTLLPGSSLFPLARELYRRKVFTLRDIARMTSDQLAFRVFGAEDMDRAARARDASLEAVKGRPREEIIELGRSVANEELIPRLYPQGVDLIGRHKRAGREVYICSASPEDYLAVLAEELDMDGVVGSRAEVDAEDRYTGHMLGELCHNEEKARRVKELAEARGIDLARSWAYSDSVNDLPLLELVGFPVAMNPDHTLRQIARQRGWQRLDYRTARRRTLVASWAGGVAAAAGAIGYATGFAVGRSRGTEGAR
jgi:HAD superfamily hydrolase (TIGR01490 family)